VQFAGGLRAAREAGNREGRGKSNSGQSGDFHHGCSLWFGFLLDDRILVD
jgi:hypothetical protein